MPRLVLAAISTVLSLGFCVYSIVTTWVFPGDRPLKTQCDNWLDHPTPRWVSLSGCVLDVDQVIVQSAEGDFEKLVNRQKGLSMKPYPSTPVWVAAWAPVRTEWMGSGLVRAAYRLESKDLLTWINTLERADEREKERMWADPVALRRLSRPGVLPGHAEKPTGEGLQKALGSAAVANLLVVNPGEPPPPRLPTFGILSGLAGLALLVFLVRRRPADEPTAEQQITRLNVSDVKLELGALEELRAEEREERRNRKID